MKLVFLRLIIFIRLIAFGVWEFAKMIFFTIFIVKDVLLNFIIGVIYQPVIFCLTYVLFAEQIEFIFDNYMSDDSWLQIVFYIFLIFCFVLIVNAAIELGYYLFSSGDSYKIVFKIQKAFYNYALIIISLMAFWYSFKNAMDEEMNLKLLFASIVFFVCVIFTDLYGFFIHSEDKVKKLYKSIIVKKVQMYDDLF
jgi:hypothetical protein